MDADALVDAAVDELAPDASYADIHQQKDVRYAPSADWVDLIAWNVVVAFCINVAASFVHQWIRQPRDNKERRELEQRLTDLSTQVEQLRHTLLQREQAEQLIKAVAPPSAVDLTTVMPVDHSLIAEILVRNGWPPDVANHRAERLMREFEQHVRG